MEQLHAIRRDSIIRRSVLFEKRKSVDSVFSTEDRLGQIVNKSTKMLVLEDSRQMQKRWEKVIIVLAAIFFFVFCGLIVISNYAVKPTIPTPNTDKHFEEFDNPIEDIVEDVVPYVQDWFENEQLFDLSLSSTHSSGLLENQDIVSDYGAATPQTTTKNSTTSSSCMNHYFQAMKEAIPNTSPAYVKLVLRNLGDHMDRSPVIRKALHDLLTEPQSLQSLYEESQDCAIDNPAFAALACAATDAGFDISDLLSDEQSRTVFRYAVNLSVVLEALTTFLERDFHALNEYVEAMITSRRKEVEGYFEQEYAHDKEYLEFALAKYRTMAVTSQALLYYKSKNDVPHFTDLDKFARLNIMEAVKLDLEHGKIGNAKAGLAVAANTRVGPYMESNELLDQLGKEWVDAYIAWNFAFVVTSTLGADRVGKLLIPSILCTNDQYVLKRFAQRRTISLSLAMMHMFSTPEAGDSKNSSRNQNEMTTTEISFLHDFYANSKFKAGNFGEKTKLSEALGKSNVENFSLTDPDRDTVWKMFYTICGQTCHGDSFEMTDSSPLAIWISNDAHFAVYVGFVVWLAIIFTGIGWEMFMILVYEKDGWSKIHENEWKLAQFLTPIMGLVSLGLAQQKNYFSLLTVIIGMWKFGFPETVGTMYCALYDTKLGKMRRFCLFLEAAGCVIHHSSAALTMPMALTGNITIDRLVLDVSLILCLQHMVILLKYFQRYLYIVVQIILEMWFEWSVFSSYENIVSNHWTFFIVANGVVLSHWLWFISGTITFAMEHFQERPRDNRRTSDASDGSDFYGTNK